MKAEERDELATLKLSVRSLTETAVNQQKLINDLVGMAGDQAKNIREVSATLGCLADGSGGLGKRVVTLESVLGAWFSANGLGGQLEKLLELDRLRQAGEDPRSAEPGAKADMSFADAMHEAEIEAACEGLGLDEAAREFVMAGYRMNPGLLGTMLGQGGDHRDYVEGRLIVRAKLGGEPEPKFPPRS